MNMWLNAALQTAEKLHIFCNYEQASVFIQFGFMFFYLIGCFPLMDLAFMYSLENIIDTWGIWET